jgi:Asp-tRNA(Asn)/Glu-tRNA(Gln) amidotransferase A subunit family amidase
MFSTLLIAKSGHSAQLANVHVGNDNDYSVVIPASMCSVI